MSRRRRSIRIGLENWREWDGTFLEKCRLAAKNELRKAARLKPCCGYPNEPGC